MNNLSFVVVIAGSIIGRFIGQKVYDVYKTHKAHERKKHREKCKHID